MATALAPALATATALAIVTASATAATASVATATATALPSPSSRHSDRLTRTPMDLLRYGVSHCKELLLCYFADFHSVLLSDNIFFSLCVCMICYVFVCIYIFYRALSVFVINFLTWAVGSCFFKS